MTNRTKAILGLTSVFLLGGICGALIFGLVVRDKVREAQKLRDRQGFLGYFENRLNLTEAQRDSLRDELEATYTAIASLREETSERYNQLIDSLKRAVAPQLTAEQRELLEAQEQKFRRFLPKELKPGRGPGRGPNHRRGGDPSMMQPPPPGDTSAASMPQEPLRSREPRRDRDSALLGMKAESAPDAADTSREGRFTRMMQERWSDIQRRLNLSGEQSEQIKKIFQETKQRNAQLRRDMAENPVMLRGELRNSGREMRRRVASLLNEEQKAEFDRIQMETFKRKQKGRRQPAGTGG